MLQAIAAIITENIDGITKRWVGELRRTERTEVHNEMLTTEIVDGMKVMLANLAEAIGMGEAPDDETAPPVTMPRLYRMGAGSLSPSPRPIGRGTAPLLGPLARAEHAAASHGRLRQTQRYEMHEVMIEYIKLRQIIWDTVRTALPLDLRAGLLQVVPYIDRLLDELSLTIVETFHNASVRDLEKRAIHDPLTQLYNKEYFGQRLSEEMRRAVRSGDPLTVAMLDMDRLKEINDTYGHAAGDSAIMAVTAAMRDTCRRSDVPCRYGGDEFAVILPETSKLQGRVFAERLMRTMQNRTIVIAVGAVQPEPGPTATGTGDEPNVQGAKRLPLVAPAPSLSVGLATFPDDARNPETLLARADAALYRAKNAGRNGVAY